MPTESLKLFYCYAHADARLRKRLDDHLAILKREGIISEWHDGDISAGQEWEEEIHQHLQSAQIILLLISSSFLASDYCYDIEMQKALEKQDNGTAHVIPIILRECDWGRTPLIGGGTCVLLPRSASWFLGD
jgi:TIR domain-containing protein